MILDAVIIFLIILIIVLEVRRGMVKSFADMLGAILALKLAFKSEMINTPQGQALALVPNKLPTIIANFFKNYIHLSEKTSYFGGEFLVFIIILGVFFLMGILIYNNFPLGLADVFEQIFCIAFSLFTGIMAMRFLVLMIVAFGSPAMQNYVSAGSTIAQELYTLRLYNELVQWLMPLTHPGDMYI